MSLPIRSFSLFASPIDAAIRLKLDSGANAPVLYNPLISNWLTNIWGIHCEAVVRDGSQTAYAALPPQDVEIGRVELSNIRFFAPADPKDISIPSDFDGLLPLRLFQRVFISRAKQLCDP